MRIIGCVAAGTPADDTGIESVNARWKWDGGGGGARPVDADAIAEETKMMTEKKKSDEKIYMEKKTITRNYTL
jgi:hypothetical protein